jgi:hypothetical protein
MASVAFRGEVLTFLENYLTIIRRAGKKFA